MLYDIGDRSKNKNNLFFQYIGIPSYINVIRTIDMVIK